MMALEKGFENMLSSQDCVLWSITSDSSSSSSDESPARSVQSAAVPAPSSQPLPLLDKDEPRKSFGIKVQNLPVRSTGKVLHCSLYIDVILFSYTLPAMFFHLLILCKLVSSDLNSL